MLLLFIKNTNTMKEKIQKRISVKELIEENQSFINSDFQTISTELNLLRFPLFSLSDKKAKSLESHSFPIKFSYPVRKGGEQRSHKSTGKISYNAEFGKPTRRDKKFLRTIESLMLERGFPTPRYFSFDPKEVLRKLNLDPYAGKNHKDLRQCIKRLNTAHIEATIFDKQRRKLSQVGGHLIDSYALSFEEDKDENIPGRHVIIWSDWYLMSLNNGYTKPLNLDYFFALENDVAGRLFELNSLKFFGLFSNRKPDEWLSSSGYISYDYHAELCPLIPITPQKYISKAKEKLTPAHERLLGNSGFEPFGWHQDGDGFISKFRLEKVKKREGEQWVAKYWPGQFAVREYLRTLEEFKRIKAPKLAQEAPEPSNDKRVGDAPETSPEREKGASERTSEADSSTVNLAQQLIEQGIRPRAAAELVKKYPDRIERNLEAFDFLLQNPENTIKNGPAYLRRAIEEDWFIKPPEGFVSKAQKEEERRQQEQANHEWMQEYAAQKSRIISDIDATMKLSNEQRVAPMLEAWETVQRKLRKAPTPEEREKRQARYMGALAQSEQLCVYSLFPVIRVV